MTASETLQGGYDWLIIEPFNGSPDQRETRDEDSSCRQYGIPDTLTNRLSKWPSILGARDLCVIFLVLCKPPSFICLAFAAFLFTLPSGITECSLILYTLTIAVATKDAGEATCETLPLTLSPTQDTSPLTADESSHHQSHRFYTSHMVLFPFRHLSCLSPAFHSWRSGHPQG